MDEDAVAKTAAELEEKVRQGVVPVIIEFPLELAKSIAFEAARRQTSFESCVIEMLEGTEKTVPLMLNRKRS